MESVCLPYLASVHVKAFSPAVGPGASAGGVAATSSPPCLRVLGDGGSPLGAAWRGPECFCGARSRSLGLPQPMGPNPEPCAAPWRPLLVSSAGARCHTRLLADRKLNVRGGGRGASNSIQALSKVFEAGSRFGEKCLLREPYSLGPKLGIFVREDRNPQLRKRGGGFSRQLS